MEELKYKTLKLSNGLTVVHRQLDIPDVVLHTRINEGVIHEPDSKAGILHLIEHLMYRMRGIDLKQRFFEITGRDMPHALTTLEKVDFSARMPAEDFEEFLKLWAQSIKNTEWDKDEFEAERGAIINEIATTEVEGTLPYFMTNFISNNVFPKSSLGQAIKRASTTKFLRKVSAQEVAAYKKERVTADNIVLSIVGGFDSDTLETLLNVNFRNMRRGTRMPQLLTEPILPARAVEERRVLPGLPQPTFIMFFQAPGEADKDILYAHILREYLGGGMSARLAVALREKLGAAYAIGVEHIENFTSINRNFWFIGIERFDSGRVEELKQIIKKELEKVRRGEFDKKLLGTVRTSHVKTFYEKTVESPEEQAELLADQASGNLPYSLQDKFRVWQKATIKDLVRVANKTFSGPYATAILLPS